jgi:hypothetical protein
MMIMNPYTVCRASISGKVCLGENPGNGGRTMTEEKEPEIADNWPVYYPGHPEVTFADLKAGRFPKLTPEELAERRDALQRAKERRKNLIFALLLQKRSLARFVTGHDYDRRSIWSQSHHGGIENQAGIMRVNPHVTCRASIS